MSFKKIFHKKKLSTTGLIVASSMLAASAQAALEIEEVVVTAQKRAQNVQDVPVAVTVVDSRLMESMGIQSFNDLTKASPSLTIAEGNNKNQSPVNIRGIGTLSFSIGIESSVAVVIDDVPVPRAGSFFNGFSDIDRIEVLRGPQSTLFGKSASAGVLNIATKNPSDEFEASIEAQLTDDNETRISGLVSGPVSDTLGLRLSGYWSDREGHIDNLTDGKKLDGSESFGFRGKAVWEANDRLSMTFIGEYNESEDNCCAYVWQSVSPNANFLGRASSPPSVWLGSITPGEDNRQSRIGDEPSSNSTDWAASLRIDYDIGEYTLSSITAYRDWEYDWQIDLDATDIFKLVNGGPYTADQFTQEIRLTSPEFEKVDFVVGAYYADIGNTRGFDRTPIFLSSWNAETPSTSTALFGQANWHLNDKWTFITGLRANREEYSAKFQNNRSGLSFAGEDDDSEVIGRLGLQWAANDDTMFYTSYAQGYKAGGYDITSSFDNFAASNPVRPETSDAIEVGLKSTVWDGRLQVNVAAFSTEYIDFQAQNTILNPDTQDFEFRLANVGKLETKGVEIDAIALLSENLTVNFGAAFIDATIKEFANADCYGGQTATQGCNPVTNSQDLSGKELNNSPDVKFTVAGNYTRPFDDLSFDGFLNASYVWQDELNFTLLGNPRATQDAYGIFNLSAGITSKDDVYQVTAFVNNVFDQSYIGGVLDLSNILFGGQEALAGFIPRGADRHAGVRVRWNF